MYEAGTRSYDPDYRDPPRTTSGYDNNSVWSSTRTSMGTVSLPDSDQATADALWQQATAGDDIFALLYCLKCRTERTKKYSSGRRRIQTTTYQRCRDGRATTSHCGRVRCGEDHDAAAADDSHDGERGRNPTWGTCRLGDAPRGSAPGRAFSAEDQRHNAVRHCDQQQTGLPPAGSDERDNSNDGSGDIDTQWTDESSAVTNNGDAVTKPGSAASDALLRNNIVCSVRQLVGRLNQSCQSQYCLLNGSNKGPVTTRSLTNGAVISDPSYTSNRCCCACGGGLNVAGTCCLGHQTPNSTYSRQSSQESCSNLTHDDDYNYPCHFCLSCAIEVQLSALDRLRMRHSAIEHESCDHGIINELIDSACGDILRIYSSYPFWISCRNGSLSQFGSCDCSRDCLTLFDLESSTRLIARLAEAQCSDDAAEGILRTVKPCHHRHCRTGDSVYFDAGVKNSNSVCQCNDMAVTSPQSGSGGSAAGNAQRQQQQHRQNKPEHVLSDTRGRQVAPPSARGSAKTGSSSSSGSSLDSAYASLERQSPSVQLLCGDLSPDRALKLEAVLTSASLSGGEEEAEVDSGTEECNTSDSDDTVIYLDARSNTKEKLNQRTTDMLLTLKEQYVKLVQDISEQLVQLLQIRHELREQVEMRKIAIDQLVRFQSSDPGRSDSDSVQMGIVVSGDA